MNRIWAIIERDLRRFRRSPTLIIVSMVMPLIQLVEVLIVVGVLLWLVNRFIPMAGSVKSILNAVVVIALVVWILRVAGLWNSLANIRVG